MSGYEICEVFFVCCAALAAAHRTICLIISRRRAKKLGILRVKYPMCERSDIVLCVLSVAVGVYMVMMNIFYYIPSNLALLEDYRASFSQDPEFYGKLIESIEYGIKTDGFCIVSGSIFVVMSLLLPFTRGAYITKEGVVLFGDLKPRMTTARIKQGSIKFYTRTLREAEKDREYRYAFDLPENEDNKTLFKGFITTDANA